MESEKEQEPNPLAALEDALTDIKGKIQRELAKDTGNDWLAALGTVLTTIQIILATKSVQETLLPEKIDQALQIVGEVTEMRQSYIHDDVRLEPLPPEKDLMISKLENIKTILF